MRLQTINEGVEYDRPRTRGECADAERPCPFVGCKHHLFLDVNERTGAVKFNFPDLEPDEIPDSCALDVAELGGLPLEEVGELLNITRERVRQVENIAKSKIADGLRSHSNEVEKELPRGAPPGPSGSPETFEGGGPTSPALARQKADQLP